MCRYNPQQVFKLPDSLQRSGAGRFAKGARRSPFEAAHASEQHVPPELVRSVGQGQLGELQEGAAVEARFHGGEEWRKGRITRVRRDGSFDIQYEEEIAPSAVPGPGAYQHTGMGSTRATG